MKWITFSSYILTKFNKTITYSFYMNIEGILLNCTEIGQLYFECNLGIFFIEVFDRDAPEKKNDN